MSNNTWRFDSLALQQNKTAGAQHKGRIPVRGALSSSFSAKGDKAALDSPLHCSLSFSPCIKGSQFSFATALTGDSEMYLEPQSHRCMVLSGATSLRAKHVKFHFSGIPHSQEPPLWWLCPGRQGSVLGGSVPGAPSLVALRWEAGLCARRLCPALSRLMQMPSSLCEP